MINPVFKEKT